LFAATEALSTLIEQLSLFAPQKPKEAKVAARAQKQLWYYFFSSLKSGT
jgi:hypothetical protein